MKFFSERKKKGIANFVIINLLLPVLLLVILAAPASAKELTKDDAYKGLAVALGLIVLARVFKGRSDSTDSHAHGSGGSVSSGNEEVLLLARAIHAEARGEPYEGQVAVGAVIINRVKSSNFPNTIYGVIYQSGQFTSVTDGQINLEPNQTSIRAARDAISGKDPSFGALFFYNPRTATTIDWLSTRPTTVKIGNHVFAR